MGGARQGTTTDFKVGIEPPTGTTATVLPCALVSHDQSITTASAVMAVVSFKPSG